MLTRDGYKRIDDLVDTPTEVWNGYEWSLVTPKVTGIDQEVMHLTFSNGTSLTCTPYHKFYLKDGSMVEAKDLEMYDKLKKWELPIIKDTPPMKNKRALVGIHSYTQGFFSGDGSIENNYGSIHLYGEKIKLLEHLSYYKEVCQENQKRVKVFTTDVIPDKDYVPFDCTIKVKLEWLAGLLDSDGTRQSKEGSLSISSINFDFLENTRKMLSTLGIHAHIRIMRGEGERTLPDGKGGSKKYFCQQSYRLLISAFYAKKLIELGLKTYRVDLSDIYPNRDASHYVYVETITPITDKADKVYCFDEPKNHTALFNGVVTGQCAEFLGNAYNSCNLASINLYNCVSNPHTPQAKFDLKHFSTMVQYGVVFLDNVLDYGLDAQPLAENKKCISDWRAIGLGVFGLADMLIALELEYGSEKANELLQGIMSNMQQTALKTSIELAKLRGAFEKFDFDKYSDSSMVSSAIACLPSKYKQMLIDYGIRNGTLLSIAPTGSIATMCGLSGGAEPLFALSYSRTTHALEKEKAFFTVYAKSIENALRIKYGTGVDGFKGELTEEFPFAKVSHEIDPFARIKTQSILQEYVDNAISSTINLPEEANSELIFDLIMSAHAEGCKGITVFRNNCMRSPIMVTTIKEEEKEEEEKPTLSKFINDQNEKASAEYEEELIKEMLNSRASKVVDEAGNVPRPLVITPEFDTVIPLKRRNVEVVEGKTYVMATACVPKMYVTVNRMEGHLFEVFVNVSNGCSSNIGTIARMVSMAARSGVVEEEIIKELRANICPACTVTNAKGIRVETSCGAAIAKAIEMDKKFNNKETQMEYNLMGTTSGRIETEHPSLANTPKSIDPITGRAMGKGKLHILELNEGIAVESTVNVETLVNANCPECGEATLVPTGKCNSCYNCGYSKCE